MHNFPMETGTVAGLLKSYLGLSSALFAQLYAVLVPAQAENRAAGFVMLCAVGGGAVAVSMTPFIVKVGNNGGNNGGNKKKHRLVPPPSVAKFSVEEDVYGEDPDYSPTPVGVSGGKKSFMDEYW